MNRRAEPGTPFGGERILRKTSLRFEPLNRNEKRQRTGAVQDANAHSSPPRPRGGSVVCASPLALSRRWLLLVGLIVIELSARGADCLRWVQRTDVGAPEARAGHVMAYDTDRGVTVMFGGHRLVEDALPDFVYFNDTWEYDGIAWRRIIIDGPSPLWRTASAMCYDSVRHEMVLAGGYNSHDDEKDGYLHDTWVYRSTGPGHGVWSRTTDLAFSGVDPLDGTRAGHAMVFDSRRGVAVLVGGTKGENSSVGAPDTDRTSEIQERWSEFEVWGRPSALHLFDFIIRGDAERYTYYEGPTGHVLVFDSDTGLISLGGGAYYYFIKFDEWRDLDWEQFFPISVLQGDGMLAYATPVRNRPLGGDFIGSRRNFAAAYDTHRKRIVVFGGQLAGENREGKEDPGNRHDELEYRPGTDGSPNYVATRLAINTPPARELHTMVYDIRRRRMVLFGGSREFVNLYNDTWEYGLDAVPVFFVDASNAGVQDGSLARPFRTIREAITAAAPDCPTILSIQAGDYREGAFSIRKPMRLEVRNGPVRIH